MSASQYLYYCVAKTRPWKIFGQSKLTNLKTGGTIKNFYYHQYDSNSTQSDLNNQELLPLHLTHY